MSVHQKLCELGITLPIPVAPAASYAAYLPAGEFLFIAGQVPMVEGQPRYIGRLGDKLTVEDGIAAARLCGINILSQVSAALNGDLERVISCIRLGGFVSATPQFTEHPKVINGASDLMLQVFGDKGKHARAAVGVTSLPRGVGVEIDAIFRIR